MSTSKGYDENPDLTTATNGYRGKPRPPTPAERSEPVIALQVTGEGAISCSTCGTAADLDRSCEITRHRNGTLTVRKCHACLVRKTTDDVDRLLGAIVRARGVGGAVQVLTDVLTTPNPGSAWKAPFPQPDSLLVYSHRGVTQPSGAHVDTLVFHIAGVVANRLCVPPEQWRAWFEAGQVQKITRR